MPLFSGVGSEPLKTFSWSEPELPKFGTFLQPFIPTIPTTHAKFNHVWGIGATIMGISLFIGRLVTPYAEKAFASLDFQSRGPRNRRKCSIDLLTMKSQLCTSGWWFQMPRFMKVHPAAGVVALGAFVALFKAISSFLGGMKISWLHLQFQGFSLLAHLWMMEWYTYVWCFIFA